MFETRGGDSSFDFEKLVGDLPALEAWVSEERTSRLDLDKISFDKLLGDITLPDEWVAEAEDKGPKWETPSRVLKGMYNMGINDTGILECVLEFGTEQEVNLSQEVLTRSINQLIENGALKDAYYREIGGSKDGRLVSGIQSWPMFRAIGLTGPSLLIFRNPKISEEVFRRGLQAAVEKANENERIFPDFIA